MALYENTRKGPGDLIATEPDGWTYTRESAVLDNDEVGAITVDNPTGYPVGESAGGGRRILVAGEEAQCIGLIIQGEPLDALPASESTSGKYAILARGAATVRPSGIATVDPAGADYDVAAILTALAALIPPILPVDEAIEVTFDNLAAES